MSKGPYFAKYRGIVKDNKDPEHRGRIRVQVPNVFGTETTTAWAEPSLPYAGPNRGLFLIPPVGTNVWIEFEDGNGTKPIWTGCFWPEGEVPVEDGSPDIKILKTDSCTIKLDDTSGSDGITIEFRGGAKIVIDNNGIEINNGSAVIKLGGSQVSVNNGALEVT